MAGRSLSLCRIGDQVLYVDESLAEYYAQGYYQLREIAMCFHGRISKYTAFGRLANRDSERSLNFRVPREVVPEFDVIGVPLAEGSVAGRILRLPRLISRLRKCVQGSEINWFMLPSFAGLIGLLWTHSSGIRVAQMVGDWEPLALAGANPVLVGCIACLTKLALRRADLVVFVSEQLRRRYGSGLDVPIMVGNESRLSLSMLHYVDRREVHSPVRMLFAGRLAPEKGLDVLFSALAHVAGDIPCELLIAGSGSCESQLRMAAQRLGVDSLVRWLGWVPWGEDLFSVMRRADLLVLPSLTEGLPLVLVDAMSQSLPIAASASGGIPELIQDGRNGLLFRPGDVTGLTQSVRRLVYDVDLRLSLVANGLLTAARNTLEENTGKVADEIVRMVENRGMETLSSR